VTEWDFVIKATSYAPDYASIPVIWGLARKKRVKCAFLFFKKKQRAEKRRIFSFYQEL
jgi:hypothetical protein